MIRPVTVSHRLINLLNAMAPWVAFLLLRFLLGWEFLEAGLEKFHGENWFMEIRGQFPFPFNVVPANISWAMATGFEIIGGIALMAGVGTRFFATSLMILTIVATAAVHWPSDWQSLAELARGYAITDKGYGNFKLPLLFLAMLLPLIFMGPGKFSLDALLKHLLMKKGCLDGC